MRGNSREKPMVRTEEIPAGKYAGMHRAALYSSFSKPGGGPFNFKRVVCGGCEKRYDAHMTECPRCGGSDE